VINWAAECGSVLLVAKPGSDGDAVGGNCAKPRKAQTQELAS